MSLKKIIKSDLERQSKLSAMEYWFFRNFKIPLQKKKLEEPRVVPCRDDAWKEICVEPYDVSGGRFIPFLIMDKGLSIGAILMKNDTPNLKVRDEFIGWKDKERLQFIANIEIRTLSPELIPEMLSLALPDCLKTWNAKYKKQHLVGLTTMSLQQDLDKWVKMGEYEKKIKVELSAGVKEIAKKWMKIKYPRKKFEEIFDILKLKVPTIVDKKQVYFYEIYKEALPFLRKDIEEIKIKVRHS